MRSDPITTAELLVADHVSAREGTQDFYVHVVWFCYILSGWKALVTTSLPDGRYYEITHDMVKRSIYMDTYIKKSNATYPEVWEKTDA